ELGAAEELLDLAATAVQERAALRPRALALGVEHVTVREAEARHARVEACAQLRVALRVRAGLEALQPDDVAAGGAEAERVLQVDPEVATHGGGGDDVRRRE